MAEQAVLVAEVLCPGCDSPNLRSSTVCGECGERLFVRHAKVAPAVQAAALPGTVDERCLGVPGCTCGYAGLCACCVMFLYDNGLAL